jgi:hypothetical protein
MTQLLAGALDGNDVVTPYRLCCLFSVLHSHIAHIVMHLKHATMCEWLCARVRSVVQWVCHCQRCQSIEWAGSVATAAAVVCRTDCRTVPCAKLYVSRILGKGRPTGELGPRVIVCFVLVCHRSLGLGYTLHDTLVPYTRVVRTLIQH